VANQYVSVPMTLIDLNQSFKVTVSDSIAYLYVEYLKNFLETIEH